MVGRALKKKPSGERVVVSVAEIKNRACGDSIAHRLVITIQPRQEPRALGL